MNEKPLAPVSPKKMPDWLFIFCLVAGILLLMVISFWSQYIVEQRNIEKRNAEIKEKNAALAKDILSYSDPIVEAINKYKEDRGEYPDDLLVLVPQYLQDEPYAAFGERIVYFPEGHNGAPFYFGFSGNYPGLAFMHGWAYVYCPKLVCDGTGEGVYRIDDDWIYIHSSWN